MTKYIFQVSEKNFKVIKYLTAGNESRFLDIIVEDLPEGLGDPKVGEKIEAALKRLKYKGEKVTLCLPRDAVTSRYIRIPTRNPQEIENMVSLQASRFLPYSNHELITGYQVISSDNDGYSYVNIIVAHNGSINRYASILENLGVKNLSVALSSFGIASLYNHIEQNLPAAVIIMDMDPPYAELAVVSSGKLVFSRSFRIKEQHEQFPDLIASEINQTVDAYCAEVSDKAPVKLEIIGSTTRARELADDFSMLLSMPLSYRDFKDKIDATDVFIKKAQSLDTSITAILGLGLVNIPDTLNLLPVEAKEELKKRDTQKKYMAQALFSLAIILVWTGAFWQNISNKQVFLSMLSKEVGKEVTQARPLEKMERRLAFLSRRSDERPSVLDTLYALHKIAPLEVTLNSFNYKENNELDLRGQATQLGVVFDFAKGLAESEVFKGYDIKVNYATERKGQGQGIFEFEITCGKKERRYAAAQ